MRRTLVIVVFAAFVGGGAFLVNLAHTLAHRSRPLTISLRARSDGQLNGSFVAELDAYHEIELAVDWRKPTPEVRKLILKEGRSILGVGWTVSSESNVVASGDSHEYLYIRYPSSLKRGLHDWVLGRSRQAPWEVTAARGVGRFRAEAGRRYDVVVKVGTPPESFRDAQAHLVVRIERQLWKRYCDETRYFAYAGLATLGVAALVIIGQVRRGSKRP